MHPAIGARTNPYVGPRAFLYGERIYGRDRESEELLDLLIAERIVLLYSPSGAGKTSLVQAALIPALEREEFEPLPVIRVGQAVQDRRANRYVLSALLSLEPRVSSEATLTVEQLSGMQFGDYLDHREKMARNKGATVLIFDQFEEILTLDPLDQDAKREFFQQVGVALRDADRWALFSMREDYFAALDPYLRAIPTRLKSTFRLDLLSADCARRAIQEPAREQGVDFTDAAALKLVDDLRAVAVQTPSGIEQRPGPYVEPVQLQVVCYRLWEHLAPDDYDFRPEEIEATGDVDSALAEYYADRVRQIAEQTRVNERHIREWCDRRLITGSGIRGQVLMDPEGIEGLGTEVVLALENVHLIRREDRRGAAWLELSHDRFLKPIRANNAAWFERHLNLLQKSAAAWQRQGRPDSLCLDGQALREAERLATAHPEELTEIESEFLEICRGRRRARRWRRVSLVQAAVVLLIALLAALAVAQRREAQAQAKLAAARGLAARAVALLDEQLDLALLLAYKAAEIAPDVPEVASSLLTAVVHNPRLIAFHHGHDGPVSSAAFSPDGRLLATGDFNGRLILWDVQTGAALRVTKKFVSDAIRSIAFSPDGKMMAVCSKDHSIVLEDRDSDKIEFLQLPNAHPEDEGIYRNVWSLGFSNDSSLLVSGDGAGRIIVWDVVTREPLFEDRPAEGEQEGNTFAPSEVRAAAISGNGEVLAAGYTRAEGPAIRIWKRQEIGWFRADLLPVGHDKAEKVHTLAFSPDGLFLAVGTSESAVHLIDLQTGAIITPPKLHEGRISSLAFDPAGTQLVTASNDGTLRLWKVPSMETIGPPLTGHIGWVQCVAFARQQDSGAVRVASGGVDHKVILWDPSRHVAELTRADAREQFSYAFSPDSLWEATGDSDGGIVLRRRDGTWHVLSEAHRQKIRTIAFSSDSRFLATSSRDGTVLIHELGDGTPALKRRLETAVPVSIAALNVDGTRVATGTTKGEMLLWDVGTGEKLGPPLSSFPDGLYTADFSPDGRWLAAGGYEHFPVMWDLESGVQLRFPDLHNASIRSVAFSRDGKTLVTASGDNTLILWDVTGRKPRGPPLVGHRARVLQTAFSPDGKLLASASEDRSVLLWDVATASQIGPRLLRHLDVVRALSFRGDGKQLLSGSYPGDTAVWDLDPERWREQCRQRANRNLSKNEWNSHIGFGTYAKIWSDLPVPGEEPADRSDQKSGTASAW